MSTVRPMKEETRPFVPCKHTCVLASAIADDASIVVSLIAQLIGERCNEDSDTLAAMRMLVLRMGALADEIFRAHRSADAAPGAFAMRHIALQWFLDSDTRVEAFTALQAAAQRNS